MKDFIKKNINEILGIFLLLSPILDLLTGICIHTLKINFTIGIIVRILFLLFIVLITVFIFKKKKLIVPYLIIGLYFILYIVGIILFKNVSLMSEIQGLIKVFYFPILFISLYSIRDNIRISNLTLLTVLFLYLIFIFIPTLFGLGYKTYEITKAGTLGFYNSANEISGIISLLTPILFIIFVNSKRIIPKVLLVLMYLMVILMIGTKTPLLTLGLTIGFSLLYLWIKSFKEKKYTNVIISLLVVIIAFISLIVVLPKTNFYKNIETHLDYLEVDHIEDIFKDEELVDHFIFSQRLTFLKRERNVYIKSKTYEKLFGVGYLNENNKATKLIEMDYFDIFYHHGIIGFIIYFSISTYLVLSILENRKKNTFDSYMSKVILLIIIFLSFFTGHIITAPSVSLLAIILIISIENRKKKDLLFADVNMEIGGIEKAQINLLNKINYNKYNVVLVLEEKKGILLKNIPKEVIVRECKVSNNKIVPLRKLINVTRKLYFKILNYQNYDFSCCYTTYSYSSNAIAKFSSINNSIYIHSDYSYVYPKEKDYREFFDSRRVDEYKSIIFVSNESKNSFLNYYKDLKDKTYVFNNFIDTKEITNKSKETIPEKKNKNTLFVFVGRLDDSSKKLKRAINIIKNIKNTELWIIGDGPDRKMYEEYSKGLNVVFIGRKENPYPYMKEADYIILTSDYEGFPVTYLEAITLNKNIITTIITSDESINIEDYAYIISKDEETMIKEVNKILKENKKVSKIDIDTIQNKRIKELEKLFN